MRVEVNQTDIEQLYRAVADEEPREDILQRIYDMFGDGLRPPLDEIRLADRCKAKPAVAHHG